MKNNNLYVEINNILSSPRDLINLVNETSRKLHSISGVKYRPPGFYEITEYAELYAIGDLHGDLDTFMKFLEINNILEKLETERDLKILLLGDYVDRGIKQIELLVAILYLKNKYPDNFILLRGNHEPPPFLIPYPHDFYEYVYLKYGKQIGDVIYSFIMRFFQKLAYGARIPSKILFLHGGPPTTVLKYRSFEEAFSIGKPVVDDNVIEEILWSDPVEYIETCFTRSPRGAGVLFSNEITEVTLKLANVKYIVRGHEAVNGYKVNHNNRVVTLFDTKVEPYNMSKASYLLIRKDDQLDDIIKRIYLF